MKRSVTRGLALVGVSAVAIAGAAGLVAQENSTQKLVPPQAVAIQDDGYADLVEAIVADALGRFGAGAKAVKGAP